MADDNKIQFDIELNEGSIDSSFKAIDDRAVKSAKSSAAVFGEHFQRQEQELQASIERIVNSTKKVAQKSAKESAAVFGEQFKKQDEIYKASVKNNIDAAIEKITRSSDIKKSAKESAAVFEEAFNSGLLSGTSKVVLPSITELAAGFFLLQNAANIAGQAIKSTLGFIILGENEIKLDKKFIVLAEQAGLVADVFKRDLTTATKGLVGETELLNVASEAFVRIGNNAKDLPQILELARKTFAVFGGSIVENTDKITNAIFSGQTRQLRSLGILVDTNEVYKNYAKSLGTVVPLLSEQQKQTAILNAVLEQGNKRFKDISSEVALTEGAFQRLKTVTGDLIDETAILVSKSAGGFLSSIFDGLTKAANELVVSFRGLNAAPGSVDKITSQLQNLNIQLKESEANLKNLDSIDIFLGAAEGLKKRITDIKSNIASLQGELTKLNETQTADQLKKSQNAAAEIDSQQSAEILKRRQDLNLKIIELENQRRASEVQLAQDAFSREQNSANAQALFNQQNLQAQEAFNQQKAQLEKFFSENGIVDETLRQQAREELEAAHLNRMLQLQLNFNEQKKQIFFEGETQAISAGQAFNSVMEGINAQARNLSVSAAKSFKTLGSAMLTTIGNGAGQAFAAFGRALKEGGNALEAFGKALLNSLGQVAIQIGSTLILIGIGYSLTGLGNGPAIIAAGAALAVAGGVLTAFAGTGGGGGGGGISSGGGSSSADVGFSSSSPVNDPIAIQDTIAQTPQTAVNVTIQGNVLDRRETGLEIAKILEEQFADQGLVIRGA